MPNSYNNKKLSGKHFRKMNRKISVEEIRTKYQRHSLGLTKEDPTISFRESYKPKDNECHRDEEKEKVKIRKILEDFEVLNFTPPRKIAETIAIKKNNARPQVYSIKLQGGAKQNNHAAKCAGSIKRNTSGCPSKQTNIKKNMNNSFTTPSRSHSQYNLDRNKNMAYFEEYEKRKSRNVKSNFTEESLISSNYNSSVRPHQMKYQSINVNKPKGGESRRENGESLRCIQNCENIANKIKFILLDQKRER